MLRFFKNCGFKFVHGGCNLLHTFCIWVWMFKKWWHCKLLVDFNNFDGINCDLWCILYVFIWVIILQCLDLWWWLLWLLLVYAIKFNFHFYEFASNISLKPTLLMLWINISPPSFTREFANQSNHGNNNNHSIWIDVSQEQTSAAVWNFRECKNRAAQFAKLHSDVSPIFCIVWIKSQHHQFESPAPCNHRCGWRE